MTSTAQLVHHRYSANSCTLEVTAAESVLSRWSQQPVLKQVRFRVLIENPETDQPELMAQGNQSQLQALTVAVQQYVQDHLTISRTDSLSGALPSEASLSTTAPWPLGLHRLAIDLQAEPLSLSTLDLFDLAEVLDQCERSLQLLPTIASTTGRRRRPFLKSYSLWAGSAVAAMVLAVGVTTTLRQHYQTGLSPQADTAVLSESAISQEDRDRAVSAPSSNDPRTIGGTDADAVLSDATEESAQKLEQPTANGEAVAPPPDSRATNRQSAENLGASRQQSPPTSVAIAPAPPNCFTGCSIPIQTNSPEFVGGRS